MDENKGGGAFFAGFLLGVLAGAAVALLYTPQSGEKTRFLIQEKGIELKTQVEEKLPAQQAAVTEEVEIDIVEEVEPSEPEA
jgi:gas vesicle protein